MGRGGRVRPTLFLQSLFFAITFGELETVVIEGKLIINSAPLTHL